jgi:hypothetical protein
MSWQLNDPPVGVAGDIGGDGQVTEAYEARWSHHLADGSVALVTRAFYVAGPHTADDPAAGPLRLECQTEYLICTNIADPGGTEVWSDYVYSEGPDGFDVSGGDATARAAAQQASERGAPDDYEWYSVAPPWFPDLTP